MYCLLFSVVIYYERRIIPSGGWFFSPEFANLEWTCSRFFKEPQKVPVECRMQFSQPQRKIFCWKSENSSSTENMAALLRLLFSICLILSIVFHSNKPSTAQSPPSSFGRENCMSPYGSEHRNFFPPRAEKLREAFIVSENLWYRCFDSNRMISRFQPKKLVPKNFATWALRCFWKLGMFSF